MEECFFMEVSKLKAGLWIGIGGRIFIVQSVKKKGKSKCRVVLKADEMPNPTNVITIDMHPSEHFYVYSTQ